MSAEKDYVVGKGEVHFDQFEGDTLVGTGERYLGNTPELSTSSDEETLDHYDSDSGLNVKDASVTIEKSMTGSLVTDHISPENVAMFFGGTLDPIVVAAAPGLTETKVVRRGRWYQLGVNTANPTGARKINTVTLTVATVLVPALNNYEVDLENGRVFIENDAPGIEDDDSVVFGYGITAQTRYQIVGKGTEVRGSLRFISKNPVGSQKNFFYPYVKLTANGDFALKSDEWMQIPFSFEVLKKDANTERVYVDVL